MHVKVKMSALHLLNIYLKNNYSHMTDQRQIWHIISSSLSHTRSAGEACSPAGVVLDCS